MTILRYVLVDRDDQEGNREYMTLKEAREAAGESFAIVERSYELSDTELVWTPDGGSTWPTAKEIT